MKNRGHFGGLDMAGRIILKWILKKRGVRVWNWIM